MKEKMSITNEQDDASSPIYYAEPVFDDEVERPAQIDAPVISSNAEVTSLLLQCGYLLIRDHWRGLAVTAAVIAILKESKQ